MRPEKNCIYVCRPILLLITPANAGLNQLQMPYSNISAVLSSADKTAIQSKIDGVKTLLTFLVNLTEDERKKLFKMGDKSVAFVQKALQAAQANPTVIPSTFNMAEFDKDVVLYSDLRDISNWLSSLIEGVNDTMLALGNESMREGVAVYNLLKEASKTNSALSDTVRDVGDRFKKAGRQEPSVVSIAPQGSVTLAGVVPERLFKNLGTGTLDVFKGNAAVGQKFTVGGKSSAKIPAGWTVITVVDTDPVAVGICSVIQK